MTASYERMEGGQEGRERVAGGMGRAGGKTCGIVEEGVKGARPRQKERELGKVR